MTGYVICRRAERAPSGCEYWSGTVACLPREDGPGQIAYLGAAVSRHNVLVIDNEVDASQIALWLNTCPVPRAITDVGLWQIVPVGRFGEVAA